MGLPGIPDLAACPWDTALSTGFTSCLGCVGMHAAPRPHSWKIGDGSSLNPGKDSLGQSLWVAVPTS